MKVIFRYAIAQITVLSLVTLSAVAQQERGVLQGWLEFADLFGTGTPATGGVFYDLVNVEYQAFAQNLEPNTTHYIYLFEHRPPEGFGAPNDWSAWGGVETGAFEGEDDKFFFLGEFETNHRGIGTLSVSMGADSAAMMRRFNMIAIWDHRRPPGESMAEMLVGRNGEFYGIGIGLQPEPME